MAKSISVKIPTSILIEQIEAKIAEVNDKIANYPTARKQYEADLEAYKAKVAEFVSDYVVKNIGQIGFEYDAVIRLTSPYRGSKVELEFDASAIAGFPEKPEEPNKPNETRWFGNTHATQKELLEKNLKILKMTSQEQVSASTYGAVMELL
jgi:hypothetical protein